MHLVSMVCPRMGGEWAVLGNLSSKCSTREQILPLITIALLSTILKNYQEIIEKSFLMGWEFDTKCRPKGGEIVLLKTEMSKFNGFARPLSWGKPLVQVFLQALQSHCTREYLLAILSSWKLCLLLILCCN